MNVSTPVLLLFSVFDSGSWLAFNWEILNPLNVVKVGRKFLLPVGNNWNSFVKFRRLRGGHTCHIKRAACNFLICLRNIVILR